MASSVTVGAAWWMDGPTFNGSNLRPIFSGLFAAQAAQCMSGVLPGGGALSVGAGSGMQVTVATGTAVVASSAGVTSAGYVGTVLTSTTLTVTGSDPVNDRIDLVCATFTDVGSSASAWKLQVITGTPAPSPSAPATPSNSLALATVLVPASSSSVSSGNISDQRVFTAMQGGIIPVPNLAGGVSPLTGYQGTYIHDRATTRLARLTTGGAVVQPNLLPFAPQQASRGTNLSQLSGLATVCSLNVTTDGNTDLEIQVFWAGLSINNSAAFGLYGAEMLASIDGVSVAGAAAPAGTNATGSFGGAAGVGGGFTHVTASGADRPGAGSHVVALEMLAVGDGTHPVVLQCSGFPATLYVRAAPL